MYKIIKIIIQVYCFLFKHFKIILNFIFFTIFFLFFYYFIFIKIRLNKVNLNKTFFKYSNSVFVFNFFEKNNSLFHYYFDKKFFFIDKFLIRKKYDNQCFIIDSNNIIGNLTKEGLNFVDIFILSNKYNFLNKIKIGQRLIWKNDKNSNLINLKLFISENEQLVFYREKENGLFYIKKYIIQGIWINKLIQGTIIDNFIDTALRVGLNKYEIYESIRLLRYRLNLNKLQKGDKFIVLLNREIFKGLVKKSKLLAIQFLTKRKNYYLFRAKDGYYYDIYGHVLEKYFLSIPTFKKFKVSSRFSFNRINPITGIKTPHKGVDFSMPNGTPVLSSADGKVIVAKHDYFAGNFVVIRHRNKYVTRYMHLRNYIVKIGQMVKKGDIIAFSGNTGRVTGPHLHYELWLKKKPVDPLSKNFYYSIDHLIKREKMQYFLLLKFYKYKLI